MAANNVNALQQALDNMARLLVLTTQAQTSPTQDNVDAVIAAYTTAQTQGGTEGGSLVPKPTYSLDGESYDWAGYAVMLQESILRIQKLIVLLGGNYLIRSRSQV